MNEISHELRAAYDAAFERWVKYEQETYKANTHHLTFLPPNEPPSPPPPAIAYPREALLEMRASYVLLRNTVAELLGLHPEKMTKGEVLFRMIRLYDEARRPAPDVG